MRDRLRTVIVPGLDELVDPDADPKDLIALADRQSRRLRAELEALAPDHPVDSLDAVERAREDEREWVRGYLHDTALQHLEWIAGDGMGTGLTSSKIAESAERAASDLRRWIDDGDEATDGDEKTDCELLDELEQAISAQARAHDAHVELVDNRIGHMASPPTSEQVEALTGAVREAVNNAQKHAQASNVIVRIETAADGCTSVTVADDGVGLDPERVASTTGIGLATSIVGRMKRAGGHALLEDAPGGGTLVKLITSRQGA